jgi:hypothetical protein
MSDAIGHYSSSTTDNFPNRFDDKIVASTSNDSGTLDRSSDKQFTRSYCHVGTSSDYCIDAMNSSPDDCTHSKHVSSS